MRKAKAHELRQRKLTELVQQLEEFQKELASLRVQKVTGTATNKLAKITSVKKSIARVKTVYNEKRKLELKEKYKNKKLKPLPLRKKKTRAMRRALTLSQKHKVPLRVRKKLVNRPRRNYALMS